MDKYRPTVGIVMAACKKSPGPILKRVEDCSFLLGSALASTDCSINGKFRRVNDFLQDKT